MKSHPTVLPLTAAALLGAVALTLASVPATAQLQATPQNPIAADSETWGASSRVQALQFVDEPDRFWNNFYDSFFGKEVWHPQHVVRLANKDGRAYFMVSQSREHNGYLTVLRTEPGQLDPATDVVMAAGGDAVVGKYVWQTVFTGEFNGTINPVGNWNHPGKMDVLGGVLVVAAQNWDYGSEGTSIDKVLFYDVSDPEEPRYQGAITADELGVREVATVGLVKTPSGDYLLTAGGDSTYATLAASKVSPNFADWRKLNPNDSSFAGARVFSGQHGMNFNSYQRTSPAQGAPAAGVERVMYFDANDESMTFNEYVQDTSSGMLVRAGASSYGIGLPGASRDWDTSSLYVSAKGKPIVYTVKSQSKDYYELYQVDNP